MFFGLISFMMMILSTIRAVISIDAYMKMNKALKQLEASGLGSGNAGPSDVVFTELLFSIGLPIFFLSCFVFALTRKK